MSLQLRRGSDADRLTITPVEGELIYCTDTKLMWVGDGSTVGGVPASSTVTGPSGTNTAYGEGALVQNVEGVDNTAVGQFALESFGLPTEAGYFVTGVRYIIGWSGDTDFTAVGAPDNNEGTSFFATGPGTGTGGAYPHPGQARRNTAVGRNAAPYLVSGERNTAIGQSAMRMSEFANRNVAVGQDAGLYVNQDHNTAVGQGAGQGSGTYNTAIGRAALASLNFKTADQIEAGKRYVILVAGTSDFTQIGAANNNSDTIFIATGIGTGTGKVALSDRTTSTGNNIGIGAFAGGNINNYDFASGALTTGSDCIFIGRETHPAAGSDSNEIVIGNYATGAGSNTTTIGHTTTVQTKLHGNLVVEGTNSSIILPNTAATGIKVNQSTPAWGWRDITAAINIRGVGATDPAFNIYRGGIRQHQFSVNDECFIEFHIPHDYVPGTDLHIHAHWSLATGGVSENVTWGFEAVYAKGHNQAPFSAPVTATVLQASSTTQYQHMIAETLITGASLIPAANIEVDGMILVRAYLSALSGGTAPFLHTVDIHYQSTNMATQGKAPSFYS